MDKSKQLFKRQRKGDHRKISFTKKIIFKIEQYFNK